MRVVVIESQPGVRAALRFLLSQQPDLQFAGAFGPEHNLVAKLALMDADVLLVDWSLPHDVVVQLFTLVRRLNVQPRVIVMSSQFGAEQDALDAGADAFVSKSDLPGILLGTIRSMAARRSQAGTPGVQP